MIFATVEELSPDMHIDGEGYEVAPSDSRTAVCSGVAKQIHRGVPITEVMESFPDYATAIAQTAEQLAEDGLMDNPGDHDFPDRWYETMLEIVEEDL